MQTIKPLPPADHFYQKYGHFDELGPPTVTANYSSKQVGPTQMPLIVEQPSSRDSSSIHLPSCALLMLLYPPHLVGL